MGRGYHLEDTFSVSPKSNAIKSVNPCITSHLGGIRVKGGVGALLKLVKNHPYGKNLTSVWKPMMQPKSIELTRKRMSVVVISFLVFEFDFFAGIDPLVNYSVMSMLN